MKRLMDEAETARQWTGSSSTTAAGVSARRPRRRRVSHRRRRRLGGRARGVHPAPQAPPRRHRHGVRAHPAPRPHAPELPARRAGQGHDDDGQPGRGRHARSSRTTSTSSRPTRTSRSTRGRLTLASRRARRPTVAPVRRLLPPLARRGPRQPRDRRRAFGNRLRRHRGLAGHQGGERHHLRAGSRVGEVRRHAAQRGRRRRRRLRAGDPRARRASWCA